VAEGVTVTVAAGNSATGVAVGAGPHAANSEILRHTTRSKARPFLGTPLRARCVRIVVRLEILRAPEPHIEIHPAWRKRIPVVHPVTGRT
jgi:hypothetical protein